MTDYPVVINAGSSSVKVCVYREPQAAVWGLETRGQIESSGRRVVRAGGTWSEERH